MNRHITTGDHTATTTQHTVQRRMAESAKIKLMLAKIGILSKPNLSEKACILDGRFGRPHNTV
jgi:hypothetical protein